MKRQALWVAYRAQLTNGMLMTSDGFYEGALPVTPEQMVRIKSEIVTVIREQVAKMKPVDAKGQLIVGAPKLDVQVVEISCIQPAEVEGPDAIN